MSGISNYSTRRVFAVSIICGGSARVEQDGDRIRYRNHVNGRNGKLKSCEAYLAEW